MADNNMKIDYEVQRVNVIIESQELKLQKVLDEVEIRSRIYTPVDCAVLKDAIENLHRVRINLRSVLKS